MQKGEHPDPALLAKIRESLDWPFAVRQAFRDAWCDARVKAHGGTKNAAHCVYKRCVLIPPDHLRSVPATETLYVLTPL